MKKYRIIIAGGRDFNNYFKCWYFCDHYLKNLEVSEIEIVSGTANGADKLGERYAKEKGFPIKQFPANWSDLSEPCVLKYRTDGTPYNALAGNKRNKQMADYSTHLVAFHDGISKGTYDMIEIAKTQGLKVRVINY